MKRHVLYFPGLALLFDAADAGSGGGSVPGSAAPGSGTAGTPPAASATPAPGSAAPASGTPAPAATPASTSGGFTYKEDRSDWIPRHRFNEESTKAQTLAAQIRERDAKIAALAGLAPQDPNSAKTQQIRDAFADMFPHLKPLLSMTAEQVAALTKVPDVATRFQSTEQRQWQRHGNQQLSAVYQDVAEAMGIDALEDSHKEDLKTTFASWFKGKVQSELRASGGAESATLERYENGDQALLKEFTTAYTKRWVEPARRAATAQTAGRIKPVPNSTGRAQVSSVERPAKFATLDDRLDYAAKLAKERGAQFGR